MLKAKSYRFFDSKSNELITILKHEGERVWEEKADPHPRKPKQTTIAHPHKELVDFLLHILYSFPVLSVT